MISLTWAKIYIILGGISLFSFLGYNAYQVVIDLITKM